MIVTKFAVAALLLGPLIVKKKLACAACLGVATLGLGALAVGAGLTAAVLAGREPQNRNHPHPSAAEPDADMGGSTEAPA